MPHVLAPALAEHIKRANSEPVAVAEHDWLVIVSQTCDVVANKLEAEPLVEVLHCRPIPKLRTPFKDLRSTRTLDFKPNRDTHADLTLSAHAVADKYLVPREVLRDHAPDAVRRLSSTASARVLAWYALRAGRPAWPDEFVKRISAAKTVFEQALDPLKDDIAEVRIGIKENDQELEDADPYHVAVFFVVDEPIWETDVDGRAAIQAAFAKFVSELDNCKGIQVDQERSEVVSGGVFTWQETRSTDLWNFANLSHRD